MSNNNYLAKSQTIFLALQTGQAMASVTATDALAVTDLTLSPEYTTEEYAFAGENPRDSQISLVDATRSVAFTSFFPSAANPGDSPKLWEVLEALGAANVNTPNTSDAATNSEASTDSATITLFKHSTGNTHKRVDIPSSRGTVDLALKLGSRATFKVDFKGGYKPQVNVDPTDKIVPDYAGQKAGIAVRLQTDNIITLKLQPLGGDAVANNNICFGSLDAPNLFGNSLEREQTSCVDGFSLVPGASEVKILIKEEDIIAGKYNPEDFLEKEHSFELVWGDTAGAQQSVKFTKLVLKTIATSTLGPWAGYELAFSAIGEATVEVS